jgi:polysaccharide export outer membrane protein
MGARGACAEEYRLDVGDVIEISVAGMPELRQRVPVQLDGSISMPRLGRLQVAGTTAGETQAMVQSVLSSQLLRQRMPDGRELAFTVEPREIAATVVEYRPIYVDGDVSRPGEQPYRPLMTARQAISMAGGYNLVRFGAKSPTSEAADARGEYEIAAADLAKEQANIARIRRELGDRDAAVPPPASAVPRQMLLEIQKSQADLYEVNQADYQRERSFLRRGTDQLVAQTQILTRLQSEEEQGVTADKAELDRLTELLNRGAVVSQRVTDARRNVLLSSTRNLQVTAQLMLATKQKDEFARQMERTDDLRRVKLLTELSDRLAKAEQLKARGRALKERMALLSAQPEEVPGWRRVPTVSLVRRMPGAGRVRIPASEDTELCPGDVVEATLRSQADVAANPVAANP